MQNQEEYKSPVQEEKTEEQAKENIDQEFDPSTILDQDKLQIIFESESPLQIKQTIQDFKTFLKENPTSFNFFTQAISYYFQIPTDMQKFQKFLKNFHDKLPIYNQYSLQSIFFRSIGQLYIDNKDKIDITVQDRQNIANQWKQIPYYNLVDYIQKFDLQELIPETEIMLQIHEYIDKKKSHDAYKLIEIFKNNQNIFPSMAIDLIKSMTNNKEASKAADMVKSFDFNPKDFPELHERLKKTCVRYYIREKPWYYIEEIFCTDLEILGYAVEDFYFSGQKNQSQDEKNQAYSICQRWKLRENKHIKKQDILECLNEEEMIGNLKYVENPLVQNDSFRPVEECLGLKEQGHFLNLYTDFNIKMDDIQYIDDVNSQKFQEAIQALLASEMIGLDSEFTGGFTKFDAVDTEIQLIQIANKKNQVFLFDALKLPKSGSISKFFEDLLKSNIIKCGQSISGDFDLIFKHFGIEHFQIPKVIDLHTIYRKLEPEQKQSSLAHICLQMFKKELSKYDQMSDWRRRPLRQSQMHYGAMDAVVSLQCYLKMKEFYGEDKLSQVI